METQGVEVRRGKAKKKIAGRSRKDEGKEWKELKKLSEKRKSRGLWRHARKRQEMETT